jgi:hypothetical protein
MAVLRSYWHRVPMTNLYFFLTVVGTLPFPDSNGWAIQIYIGSYRAALQEKIRISFINLPCTIQNKIQKIESELLNPSVKKVPFFAPAVNSTSDQAAVTLNKALLAGNSGTTWKTKHPCIQILFRNDAILAEILITEQNNGKMPITVTVPTTLLFPLHIKKLK